MVVGESQLGVGDLAVLAPGQTVEVLAGPEGAKAMLLGGATIEIIPLVLSKRAPYSVLTISHHAAKPTHVGLTSMKRDHEVVLRLC